MQILNLRLGEKLARFSRSCIQQLLCIRIFRGCLLFLNEILAGRVEVSTYFTSDWKMFYITGHIFFVSELLQLKDEKSESVEFDSCVQRMRR